MKGVYMTDKICSSGISWQQQMRDGIRLCVEACQANDDWTKCHNDCDFDEWCTILMNHGSIDPFVGLAYKK